MRKERMRIPVERELAFTTSFISIRVVLLSAPVGFLAKRSCAEAGTLIQPPVNEDLPVWNTVPCRIHVSITLSIWDLTTQLAQGEWPSHSRTYESLNRRSHRHVHSTEWCLSLYRLLGPDDSVALSLCSESYNRVPIYSGDGVR